MLTANEVRPIRIILCVACLMKAVNYALSKDLVAVHKVQVDKALVEFTT